jgi:two-component system nitrogen regulation response regulator GlnG
MPFELQTRLLRVLSDGSFYRVGGHTSLKSNVRVIAATHQDLEERVKLGLFREDLLHRLNVIRLRLPALRERREDVAPLTRHFLQVSAHQLGMEVKRISEAALAVLEAFPFPGNVRQLENICHWLTVMAPSQSIEPKDLPPEVLSAFGLGGGAPATVPPVAWPATPAAAYTPPSEVAVPVPMGLPAPTDTALPLQPVNTWELDLEHEALELLQADCSDVWDVLTRRFESRLIRAALQTTRGRRVDAANRLGIGRNTITRKIQELGLDQQAALADSA